MDRNKLLAFITIAVLVFGLAFIFKTSPNSSEWLWSVSKEGSVLFPLIVVSALIDSINPCAFSVLIVSLVFLFGLGVTRGKIVIHGLVYIAGIFSVYLLIGLGLLQVLHIFDVPHFMSKLAAGALIILGVLNILESAFPNFPIKLSIPRSAHGKMNELLEKATLPGMFLLGALVGLCEFPCTGGPYLMVLGLLHDFGTYWRGVGYLILYNLIFTLPLVAILFVVGNQFFIEKVRAFQQSNKTSMKFFAGVLMIALALFVLSL